MAKSKALFAFFCLLVSNTFAQPPNMINGNGIDMNTSNLWGNVQEIDLKDYSPKHEQQYLKKAWATGVIYVKGGAKIEGFDLRYDLIHEELEIRADSIIKTLPLFRVDSFKWVTSEGIHKKFQSAIYFSPENTVPQIGFYEVISAGNSWSLLKEYKTIVIDPTFNAALNIGSTQTKTKINEIYYFFNGEQLVEVATSEKVFIKRLTAAKQDELKEFIKKYKLNLRNEYSLLEIKYFLNR